MSKIDSPIENLAENTAEYVGLKIDDLKLRLVKGLSVSMNHLLSMILVLFAVSICLIAAAFGLSLLIGKAIGSYAGGAFIVAGFFLLVALVVFLLRKRLFVDGFVKLFAGLFFDDEEGKK